MNLFTKIVAVLFVATIYIGSSLAVLAQTATPIAPTRTAPTPTGGISADDLDAIISGIPSGSGSTCGEIGLMCCDSSIVGKSTSGAGLSGLVRKFFDNISKETEGIFSSIGGGRKCVEGEASTGPFSGEIAKTCTSACCCVPERIDTLADSCKDIKSDGEKKDCNECSRTGIWTAIGCVDYKMEAFITHTIFGRLLGFASLILLLCIIYSAIQLQTSRGDAEKIKNTRERLYACIAGFLLIIFSVIILKILGVDILRIPGLS